MKDHKLDPGMKEAILHDQVAFTFRHTVIATAPSYPPTACYICLAIAQSLVLVQAALLLFVCTIDLVQAALLLYACTMDLV